MYGVIGIAVIVGALSVALIKKFKIKTIYGEPIQIHDKTFNKGQIIGGLIFGLGWGITGACPGPLYAQIGSGASVIVITLISAILGTWVYGKFRDKLPHLCICASMAVFHQPRMTRMHKNFLRIYLCTRIYSVYF